MSAQHAPGPWTVQALEHSFRVVDSRALKFNNSRLCDVQYWSGATRGPDRAEAHANANLMAAAPDMLAALLIAREFISFERNAFADSNGLPDGTFDADEAAELADYDTALLQINAAILKATGTAA